ncbi:baseplate J/gp47 family protein [Pedobacter sp. MW01-1-1]|uniref:baseplate J/gp47 family protein n=1 Tax=Pedobacter sp. MW01-1-1 TaxID=3383027 RepID=UPI003FEE4B07
MARTPEEIQLQIIAEKENHSQLTALDSVSNTAIWRLWVFITAQIIYYFEVLQDVFKAEVQAIIDNNQYGTLTWWYNSIKAYQDADLLLFIDNVFKYSAVDLDKRIIKYCSITDNAGNLQIKVAKQVNNEPVVLTSNELDGVVDYVNDIRPAGTRITVSSLAADLIKVRLNVYYNANLTLEIVQANVEAAITNYLANIQFDGIFYVNKLIDAIQTVPGVINDQVNVLELAAKGSGDDYINFSSKWLAKSGYFKIDPDFPLATQITYIT